MNLQRKLKTHFSSYFKSFQHSSERSFKITIKMRVLQIRTFEITFPQAISTPFSVLLQVLSKLLRKYYKFKENGCFEIQMDVVVVVVLFSWLF